jgi:RNA polymerase sigma-70 factor (ECF subfamily)
MNTTTELCTSLCCQELEESALVRHARLGCRPCMNSLFEKNSRQLRSFIAKLSSETINHDDLFQQTMYQAFSKFSQFRGDSRFATWLCGIAVNEMRQSFRRRPSMPVLPIDIELGGAQFRDKRALSPLDQCCRDEVSHRIRKVISTLSPAYRVVIELRDLEELSLPDTAKRLNLTLSATKTRHSRARRFLAQAVEAPEALKACA